MTTALLFKFMKHVRLLPFLLGALLSTHAAAQIGGETGDDLQPFVLDDVEDLDLTAGGVERDWISDFIFPSGDVLRVLALADSPELTLAPGQTPTGALLAEIPESGFFIEAGFGVPMPGVKGASTDDFPGDITSYTTLSFLAGFQPAISDLVTDVILESNATTNRPEILWNYTPQQGTTFARVEMELREPGLILDGEGATLEQMLANTRFLFFNFSAGPVPAGTVLSVYIDDIRLENNRTPVLDWQLYR